jgi:cobalt-zinc-cadmium efflux system outer membrane protein
VATYIELQDKYLEAMEALLDTRKQALAAAGQIEVLGGLGEPLVRPTERKSKP